MFYLDEEPEEEGQEEEARTEEPKINLQDKFLKTRTILIFGEINQRLAEKVTQQLLLLSTISDEDIRIILNSQGGHVESGDTIFDMIRFVKPTVKIIGTGWVASAGALIYSSVPVEDRLSLPNTRYLLHQPLGGIRGSAQDLAIEAQEIIRMRSRLNKIFAEQTGQPLDKVEHDTDRNFWMSADEAKTYGLVGRIIQNIEEI